MAPIENHALMMYLLLGKTLKEEEDVQDRYPNVSYVSQNQDPTHPITGQPSSDLNQDLFSEIDKGVYASFHQYLKGLNPGGLQNAYNASRATVNMLDSAMGQTTLWQGGNHPPSNTLKSWFDRLITNA
jgi:hypothetical protein